MKKFILLFTTLLILVSCSNPAELTQYRPTTNISYSVGEACHVQLTIYNDLQQIVKTLVNENQVAGNYSVVWCGDDNDGNKVASGTYYYELIAGDYCSVKQMLLLK